MSDLEALGLLDAPHISAGRVPTESGLRLYVSGLLERGNLSKEEKAAIRSEVAAGGRDPEALLARASDLLSELSSCAGLVAAPAPEAQAVRHVEFVRLGAGAGLDDSRYWLGPCREPRA